MSIIIAGREVHVGDVLYHTGYQAFGIVHALDMNAARLRFTNGVNQREIFVGPGGIVGGRKQVFWHQPLQLDLPMQDIGSYQRILDALVGEGL